MYNPKLNDKITFHGQKARVVGFIDRPMVVIETEKRLNCPNCNKDLGKNHSFYVIRSPSFQDHVKPLESGKKPMRVQRSRTAGFELPDNAVCVDWTSRWGNPVKLIAETNTVVLDISYRVPKGGDRWLVLKKTGTIEDVIDYFQKIVYAEFTGDDEWNYDLHYWVCWFRNEDVKNLKGKNLACFCALDQPCHADILLEIAN